MPRQSQKKSGIGSPRKKGSAQKSTDAVDILRADHETIMSLFRRHESASPEEQAALAKQIFNELDIHSTIEEEIFYPALREHGDVKELTELEGKEGAAVVDGQDPPKTAVKPRRKRKTRR